MHKLTRRISASISPRLPLSIAFLTLIALNLFAGQYLLLDLRGADFRRDTGFFVLSCLLHTAFYCSMGAIVLGSLSLRLRPSRVSLLWAAAVSLSTLCVLHWFSLKHTGLDPREALLLLLQFVRNDIQLLTMPILLSIVATPLLFAMAFAALAWIHYKTSAWFPKTLFFPKRSTLVLALAGSGALALSSQLFCMGLISSHARTSEIRNPYHFASFFHRPHSLAALQSPCFNGLPSDGVLETALHQTQTTLLLKKPNIFIIVVDSLRADMIDRKLTPNLFALKKVSIPVKRFLASANCSHISWYSLLHAVNPVYWHLLSQPSVHKGSAALRLLRAGGYKIHVSYSAADLEDFKLRPSFFGENWELADTHRVLDKTRFPSNGESGSEYIQIEKDFVKTLEKASHDPNLREGQFFLLGLFAPHWPYSWPSDFKPVVRPFAPYLTWGDLMAQSPERRYLLLNRYRNSVAFTDALIGQFMNSLRESGRMDNSIIVVIGDHGEEFGEQGTLLHGTAMNAYQLEPAFFMSIPKSMRRRESKEIPIASMIDVFPTIFDALGLQRTAEQLFQGKSLLRDTPNRYALSAQCALETPGAYLFSDENHSIQFDLDSAAGHGRFVYAREMRLTKIADKKGKQDGPNELLQHIRSSMGACD